MFNACCDVEIDDLNTVWLMKWVMTYSQWEERCSGDVRYSVGVTHQRHTTLHYTILHYTVLLCSAPSMLTSRGLHLKLGLHEWAMDVPTCSNQMSIVILIGKSTSNNVVNHFLDKEVDRIED